MHWALEGARNENRRALRVGLLTTVAARASRSSRSRSTSTSTSASARRQRAEHDLLRPDRPARRPRVHRPHAADDGDDPRLPGPLTRPKEHRGVEVPGIYWHFVDVMWIFVYQHAVPPLMVTAAPAVLNPLRCEQEAFRFLIYVAIVVAVLVGARAAAAGGPLNADLELAERAARAAGEVLLSYYGRAAGGARHRSRRDTDLFGRRPRGRARDPRAARARAARRRAAGEEGSRERGATAAAAGSSTRSTAPSTSSTASRLGCQRGARGRGGAGRGRGARPRARRVASAPCAGGGASMAESGRPLRVRGCDRLERAHDGHRLLATSRRGGRAQARGAGPAAAAGPRHPPRRRRRARPRLAWPPGALDAFYERGLKPWDWAAGRLLVEEAGGVVAGGQPPG